MRNKTYKRWMIALSAIALSIVLPGRWMMQVTTADMTAEAALTQVAALPASNVVMETTVHTIKFTTGTAGTINTVEILYNSAGFNLANARLIEAGGIGDGSLTVSGSKLIYTVSSPVSIPAGQVIRIMAGGIVNAGATATNSHTVSVVTKDAASAIIDGATTSPAFLLIPVKLGMVGSNAVNSSKIVDGSVAAADLADGSITSAKIAPAAVGPGQISNNAIQSNHILDGQVSIADLAFDPATQVELDAHKISNDHDARYSVKTDLSTPGTINTVTNPVDWTELKNVPAGFADGLDNTGGTADVVCTGCVDSTDIADGGITNVDLAPGSYGNITGVGTLSNLNAGAFGMPAVEGRIAATGSGSELTFLRRTLTSWPRGGLVAGDRYAWYNPDGKARFWGEGYGDLLTITSFGYVGIGTTSPTELLHVKNRVNNGGIIRVGGSVFDETVDKRIRFGDADFVAIGERKGKDDALEIKGRTGIYLDTWDGLFFPNSFGKRAEVQGGNVISFGDPGVSEDQIYYSNNTFHFRDSPGGADTLEPVIEVGAIRIIGGADLAEPFDIRNSEEFRPGMVVVIDPDHTGGLRVADRGYDRTVAGVISGANGLNPGVVMVKDGMTEENSAQVALTGRVYTLVDASYGAVKRGDLLTTSDTPGHAMKVTDYNKAHGAIIGKAMSTLAEGKGLVLVLVSLQ